MQQPYTGRFTDNGAVARVIGSIGVMTEKDDGRFDFASVFPSKGDSRRPPDWWGRALLYAVIAVFLAIFVWQSWGKISYIVLDLIIAMFISLALEPLVVRLVRHGWKRALASALCLVGLIIVALALLLMFGKLFVDQVISMIAGVPALYGQLRSFVSQYTDFKLPEMNSLGNEMLRNLQTSWVTNFAGQALNTTVAFFSVILNLFTVLMVSYYISASGPKMRRSVCQWLAPKVQRRFLLVWTVVQDQISGFLFSRSILALLNAFFTSIFLMATKVPYWLPLAVFCGLVSQFVPTVGTYIGGALPVVFAWSLRGWTWGLAVVAFIVVYQQIENLIFLPKVSQRTMDLNPAIAFLCVLIMGALFGALGAFLALPVTASLQALFKVYTRKYELVGSPLMDDPTPVSRSKVVEGAEAFNEHVIRPVADHIPRAAKGSSARVPVNDEMRALQEEVYHLAHDDSVAAPHSSDDSLTVAIPKGILHDEDMRKGVDKASTDLRAQPAGERKEGREPAEHNDNPRGGWR